MDIKIIGNKIAKARKEMNMSQAQLAQRLFISPQAVGKWERGESIPDIITINRLAEMLNVDFNYFLADMQTGNDETAQKRKPENNGGASHPEQKSTNPSASPERQLLTNFSGSNLTKSDFEGVTAHKRKFNGSVLRGSDFTDADFTGSSFTNSDVREANFAGTNLTDCTLSVINLTDATFNKTILVRTEFSKLDMTGVKFTDVTLVDLRFTMTDLRKTIFENCVFSGVDFEHSDLRGVSLDGQTFIDVRFDKTALNKATFNSATLKNVSFRPTYALTNKYYRAVKTICFDGAMMDKLTYAALQSMGADLSKVTVI